MFGIIEKCQGRNIFDPFGRLKVNQQNGGFAVLTLLRPAFSLAGIDLVGSLESGVGSPRIGPVLRQVLLNM